MGELAGWGKMGLRSPWESAQIPPIGAGLSNPAVYSPAQHLLVLCQTCQGGTLMSRMGTQPQTQFGTQTTNQAGTATQNLTSQTVNNPMLREPRGQTGLREVAQGRLQNRLRQAELARRRSRDPGRVEPHRQRRRHQLQPLIRCLSVRERRPSRFLIWRLSASPRGPMTLTWVPVPCGGGFAFFLRPPRCRA